MSGTPGERVARDPFDPAMGPDAYVPTAAAEQALRALEAALDRGRVAALIGPPGLGKSLLLHCLASRESQLQVLYIPFCTLTLAELSSFALGLLDWSDGPDPVVALAQHARALGARRSGVLLLVDDAGAMPLETAAGLEGLLKLAGGTLHIALAATDSDETRRVFAAFAPELDEIRLEQGMTLEEVHRYVQTRLDATDADAALRSAFAPEQVDLLFRASEGVPRRLELAAQEIVRRVLEEPMPRLGDPVPAIPVEDAAPQPPDSMRARVAALLANEPDAREVVASLRNKAAPPAPPPQPVVEPPPAKPRPSAAPADPEPPAPVVEEPRESKVGTYRMVRPTGSEAVADATPKRAAAPPQTPTSDAEAAPRTSPKEGAAASAAPTEKAPPQVVADASAPREEAGHETLFLSPELEKEFREAVRSEPRVSRPGSAAVESFERTEPAATDAEKTREREEVVADEVKAPKEEPQPPRSASPARSVSNALWNIAAAGAGVVVGVAFLWAWIQFEPVSPGDEAPAPASIQAAKTPAPSEPARAAPKTDTATTARTAAPAPRPPQRAEPSAPEPAPTATTTARQPSAAIAPAAIVRVGINAVPWAVIEADGIELGETPLAGIGIPAGPHTFRARMPDGSVREKTIVIDATNRHVVFE